MGFLPRPLVVQQRNPHSYEADFAAELPLYLQGRALTKHISDNYSNNSHFKIDADDGGLPKAIEELWVDLYERGYVEIEDVYLVQRWLDALLNIGYKFPKSSSTPTLNSEVFLNVVNAGKSLRDLNKDRLKTIYGDATFKSSKCLLNNVDSDSKPPLIFGNSDLHTGPRSDLSSLLSHLGQRIILMGYKGKETNYPEIYEDKSVKVYERNSPTLSRYQDHSHGLTSLAINKNAEFYEKDDVVRHIDAFICTFPASMCQMWLAMNKSVIFLPAHRYNLGRCTAKEWKQLDQDLFRMVQDPSDRHTIASMSRYDAEYLQYYTGIKPQLLYSFSGYYTDYNLYNPTKKEYLIFCLREGARDFIQKVKTTLAPEFSAQRVYDVYDFYTLKDLATHPAVIMLPYSVMSYRFTELYALAIPLFLPSPKFYLRHYDPDTKKFGIGHDRTSTSEPYCTMQYNLESVMRPALKSNLSPHPYSPNVDYDQDVEAEMYWLQMSDFYDWPHIQHYDSYEHLKQIVATADLQKIHFSMIEELEQRGLELNKKWCEIIGRIRAAKGSS